MITRSMSPSGAESLHPDIPVASVESVDEDWEPVEQLTPANSHSRGSSTVPDHEKLGESTIPTSAWPELASPEPIRRPLADREDSLLPPSTVSSLYNATPRSTPTPSVASVQARSDSFQALDQQLAQLRIHGGEKVSQLHQTVLDNLANCQINSVGQCDNSRELGSISDEALEKAANFRFEDFDLPPVSVREEQLPKRPFFDEGLQKAIKGAQTIITHTAKALDGIDLAHDPESGLDALRKMALDSREFENDAISTIGVVGESAAGKSSLINSLLDQQEVARTDDNGSAVTSYVTEYRYRKLCHEAPFTIEAEFLTAVETANEIKELLHDYREAFKETINDQTTTPAEYEVIIRRSNIALSTLQSIFSALDDVTEDLLQDKSQGAEEDILRYLQSLVASLTWPEGVVEGRWATTACNVEEYREKIGHLSQEGLFPLIRIVRVFMNALVLKSGVALADMPGLSDTNLARLQATKRYLDRCEQVFIVNKIGRAATSVNIQDAIKIQEQKGLVGRKKILTVVCTGSEDIDLRNAERRNIKAHASKAINKTYIQKARAALDTAKFSNSAKAIEEAKIRYASIFITARNNSIKEDIIKNYSSLATQHELKVFCVSNRYYDGEIFDTNTAKDLARSLSGIPELRQFCHTVVAEAQFYAAVHYIDVKCLGLLRQLDLWTQATSIQEREQIIQPNSVEELRDGLEEKIEGFSASLDALFEDHILQPMGRNVDRAERHAEVKSRTWAGKASGTGVLTSVANSDGSNAQLIPGTYAAFCRNNGIYATGAQPFTNWNLDMLGQMNRAMESQWTTFLNEFDTKAGLLTHEVRSSLTRFMDRLKHSKSSNIFVDTVKTQRSDLLHKIQNDINEFENNIRSTKLDAVSGDVTSFIYASMMPTYRCCSADYGTGVSRRRIAMMARRMEEHTLFRGVQREVKQQMLGHSESFSQAACKLINNVCDGVQQSIQTVLTAEAGTERTSRQLLEQMKSLVVENKQAWAMIEANSQRARERARSS
ncbi:hypothetical protein MMC13_007826 [Lambiella insularis]|nr:hypothetical protein [Lambiella insularis]